MLLKIHLELSKQRKQFLVYYILFFTKFGDVFLPISGMKYRKVILAIMAEQKTVTREIKKNNTVLNWLIIVIHYL